MKNQARRLDLHRKRGEHKISFSFPRTAACGSPQALTSVSSYKMKEVLKNKRAYNKA